MHSTSTIKQIIQTFKCLAFAISLLLGSGNLLAQTLTLDSCQLLAKQNYPLVKQTELLTKSTEYSIDNLNKGVLPQLTISGQATYQSDVTEIPINLPGITIQQVPKDQYKLVGEINQPITDLITVGKLKDAQRVQSDIQSAGLDVDLYKLKDRVNQLFFGVLMIDEQLKQNELYKKDLQNGLNKVNAALANGTDYKSNADKLKAELLRADQRTIELKAGRTAYTSILSQFIHSEIRENTVFQSPPQQLESTQIKRPELNFYASKDKSIDAQKKILTSRNLPKLGVFFQGGWGQPSPVNLFSKELSSYYIAGIRLNWSVSGLYTIRKEKSILEIDRKMNDAQKETFLFNTNTSLSQLSAEIAKLKALLASDEEIVALRNSIKSRAQVQLENGAISTNDYLKEINAEDQARQNKLLHEIQLLLAQYTANYTSGN